MQTDEQNENVRATRIELKDLSTDEQIRLEAERWEKAQRDSIDRYDGAMAKGIRVCKEITSTTCLPADNATTIGLQSVQVTVEAHGLSSDQFTRSLWPSLADPGFAQVIFLQTLTYRFRFFYATGMSS